MCQLTSVINLTKIIHMLVYFYPADLLATEN